jgi:hypothetical protein
MTIIELIDALKQYQHSTPEADVMLVNANGHVTRITDVRWNLELREPMIMHDTN